MIDKRVTFRRLITLAVVAIAVPLSGCGALLTAPATVAGAVNKAPQPDSGTPMATTVRVIKRLKVTELSIIFNINQPYSL